MILFASQVRALTAFHGVQLFPQHALAAHLSEAVAVKLATSALKIPRVSTLAIGCIVPFKVFLTVNAGLASLPLLLLSTVMHSFTF